MTVHERIDDFLNQRRLAMVGVSRSPKDFSRALFAEFRKRGYDIVPVNPHAPELENVRCFSSVKEIDPPVDTALVITPSGQALKVVQDCAEAGVRRIWLYRAIGRGSVDQAAVDYCDSKRISVIPGECPFMFFRDSGFIHRFHGMVKKLTGTFPA